MINLLNIERIVLGGGVMDAGELIRETSRESPAPSFSTLFRSHQILAATLGADASAIGAALLARDAQLS